MARPGPRRRGGPLLVTAVTLVPGGLAAWWVRYDTAFYDVLLKPPLSPPFALAAVLGAAFWLVAGAAAGLAVASRGHPALKSAALRLLAAHLGLSVALPVCLLRWGWLLPAFALQALNVAVTACMTAAFARVEREAGLLALARLAWEGYLLYLLLGIAVLN